MFRFTIRDVLWLTVIVGLVVALCLIHRTASYYEKKASELMEMNQRLFDQGIELSIENSALKGTVRELKATELAPVTGPTDNRP